MQNMSMMDHSDHSMMRSWSSGDSDESTEDDCCVKSCSCFTGGCSSIAALMKDTGDSLFIDLSSKILLIFKLGSKSIIIHLFIDLQY